MKHLLLLLLPLSTHLFALEQFNQRLHFPSSIISRYDDTQRWIAIEKSLFDKLLQTAEQEAGNKEELLALKRNIVFGIINLHSIEPTVLLTQKEFYAGLLQFLPWDGTMTAGSVFIRVLINSQPEQLNIGTRSFWYPNDVRLIPKS